MSRNRFFLAQEARVVPILAPINTTGSTFASDVIDLKNYGHVTITISMGAWAGGRFNRAIKHLTISASLMEISSLRSAMITGSCLEAGPRRQTSRDGIRPSTEHADPSSQLNSAQESAINTWNGWSCYWRKANRPVSPPSSVIFGLIRPPARPSPVTPVHSQLHTYL